MGMVGSWGRACCCPIVLCCVNVVIDLTSLVPFNVRGPRFSSRPGEFTDSSQPGIPDNPPVAAMVQKDTFVPVDPAGLTG
ncbi:hypothetical protein GCM10017567_49720 [Amycolatopsis bullii]|uniref:Secreted protein n=1 Tax=Amycolatopsis bullii TaxID=941987 RepID=A0ABQ3KI76_9PSEU|nr:hypothetical protein GCM10017567_49720 [Amycolatopsis bullii]